jgi:hypothetical protein
MPLNFGQSEKKIDRLEKQVLINGDDFRYRDLLRQLPSLNYQTLRRIIGHLNAIAAKASYNLMPNYNLVPMT